MFDSKRLVFIFSGFALFFVVGSVIADIAAPALLRSRSDWIEMIFVLPYLILDTAFGWGRDTFILIAKACFALGLGLLGAYIGSRLYFKIRPQHAALGDVADDSKVFRNSVIVLILMVLVYFGYVLYTKLYLCGDAPFFLPNTQGCVYMLGS